MIRVVGRGQGVDVLACGHKARQRRPLSYPCPFCPGAHRVKESFTRLDLLTCGHLVDVPADVLGRERRRCEVCERATANGRQTSLLDGGPR